MLAVVHKRNEVVRAYSSVVVDDDEVKRKAKDKYLRDVLKNAERCAKSYVKHVLLQAENNNHHWSQYAITLGGTINTMGIYGVKFELREYAAKYAIRLLQTKGGKNVSRG